MAEETIEEEKETPTNQEEEEATSDEEASQGDSQEAPEKPDKATASDLEKKNKELFARAKKAEEELKELKKKKKEGGETAPEGEDFWKAKVEFLIKNRDISDEEFDHIANVASNKGISLDEARKQEEDYIQYRRKKVADENKTPAPSSSSSGSQKVDFTPDMSQAQIDEALRKSYEKAKREKGAGV